MLGYAYGGFLIMGGVAGYVMSRSLPSLIAGGGLGLAVLALERPASPPTATAFAFVQSLLAGTVAAHMFSTYMKSFGTRPLVLAGLSAAACLAFLARATAPPKRSS